MGVGRDEIELHMPCFYAVWRVLLQRIRIAQTFLKRLEHGTRLWDLQDEGGGRNRQRAHRVRLVG